METSILQRLPAELRIRICEEVCRDGYLTIDSTHKSRGVRKGLFLRGVSLISTCRQLRREALPIFFALNRVYLNTNLLDRQNVNCSDAAKTLQILQQWLSIVDACPNIVDIDLGTWNTYNDNDHTTPEMLSLIVQLFAIPFNHIRADGTISMKAEWGRAPHLKCSFRVSIPLWNFKQGEEDVKSIIVESRDWVREQTVWYFDQKGMNRSLDRCERSFERLWHILVRGDSVLNGVHGARE